MGLLRLKTRSGKSRGRLSNTEEGVKWLTCGLEEFNVEGQPSTHLPQRKEGKTRARDCKMVFWPYQHTCFLIVFL